MNQLIIVYLLLALVIIYSVYIAVKYLRKYFTTKDPCADCEGCELKEIKRTYEQRNCPARKLKTDSR
jgi:hypothetical protein